LLIGGQGHVVEARPGAVTLTRVMVDFARGFYQVASETARRRSKPTLHFGSARGPQSRR
jgi:hypothetical protein